ncbi:MAG: outer membrane protein assembly factor BamD [Melioribacter sp.]|nr:outer membrane protein assembly factor BamD [Melioribacter sp.]
MKILTAVFTLSFIIGCSSAVDTSKFNAEQYYNYVYQLYNDEDYEQAIQQFQSFLLQYSGSAFNDDAQYYLGMTYFKRGQYLLSAYEFSKLIRNIPASPFVPDAQYMLAESYFQLSPPYQLDQAYTKKAIEELQAFIDFFPANKKVEEAEQKIKTLNEKLAEKDYQSALIYEKMEYENAAIKYYGAVAETYHDTKYAPLSLYHKIMLETKKGLNNDALADISLFVSRYPDDTYAKELKETETLLMSKK